MSRITGVDHVTISVGDFARSTRFCAGLFRFPGMKIMDEHDGASR